MSAEQTIAPSLSVDEYRLVIASLIAVFTCAVSEPNAPAANHAITQALSLARSTPHVVTSDLMARLSAAAKAAWPETPLILVEVRNAPTGEPTKVVSPQPPLPLPLPRGGFVQ